jgi:acetyl-CoA C-acetyltransferase
MNIVIKGAATTKFGELWDVSPRDLAKAAVKSAISDADLDKQEIQAIFVGNMLSSSLGGQDHLGSFYTEELGFKNISSMKVEGACASGGLAVHAAYMAVLSGMYETVLVLGLEKMTDHKPEEVANALMGAGSDPEREAGATFPALYAILARAHMEKYSTKETDLAAVAVKNHFHASLNSNAHFPFQITIEQVMKSPLIASPLKLLDCSPISDGAAALIISSKLNKRGRNVFIKASKTATDSLGLAERESLLSLKSTVEASKFAYKQAGVSPQNIDVAEVHDCFTIAEILAMEDLGFYVKGEAVIRINKGETRLGGKGPIVNTSGGLKACGHPVGATGVKQLVEIYQQLKGTAGKKQVEKAKVGLTHNVGGSGGTAVVHILQN